MLTLWDLLLPGRKPKPKTADRSKPKVVVVAAAREAAPAVASARRKPARPNTTTMQDRYDRMTEQMLAAYGVRVRKWRTSMSGIAWEVRYRDGSISRRIESPKPKGPMSAAIFLHEIGHHAIGFSTYKPRCLEEYHAWRFAIEQMRAHNLNITEGVHRRMRLSLKYAVAKARRRGLKQLPAELLEYAA